MDEFDCKCKIRHSKTEYDAHVAKTEKGFKVFFPEAARAPSPGQSAEAQEAAPLSPPGKTAADYRYW